MHFVPNQGVTMTTNTFTVSGMTCSHCVNSVEKEIGAIDGVESVAVDLASGSVTVESTIEISSEAFAAAVDEAGYEVIS